MTKQQKKEAFTNWWDNLTQKEAKEMKQEIMKRCFISRYIFIFWLTGRTEIPNICLSIIEEIARKRIFSIEKKVVG